MNFGNIVITPWHITVFLNVLVFFLFGIDKIKAKKKSFRIPEFVLLLLSLFFGGIGALLGMVVFNHKTSKKLFRFFVPACAVLNYYFFKDSFALLKQLLKFLLGLISK